MAGFIIKEHTSPADASEGFPPWRAAQLDLGWGRGLPSMESGTWTV